MVKENLNSWAKMICTVGEAQYTDIENLGFSFNLRMREWKRVSFYSTAEYQGRSGMRPHTEEINNSN